MWRRLGKHCVDLPDYPDPLSCCRVRLNILQLQGESELGPLKEDDQQASRKRSRPSLEGAEDHTGSLGFAALAQRSPHTSLYSPSSSSNRSTCILLHPQVTSALLDCKMVPARMRDAWPEGKSVPGTLHRIQVASSDAILPGDERFGREERIDFDALYARGREWWEEG